MQSNFLFQYCQKLVILSLDRQSVLLARRKGEADYDGTFSFIGGKMETTDPGLIEGMKREKDEEIGSAAVVRILPHESFNVLFKKKDGNSMVLPHIAGYFESGEITLSDEYSEFRWVPLEELPQFEPKIDNITEMAAWAKQKLAQASEESLVEI